MSSTMQQFYMQEISGARQRNTSNDAFILRRRIFLIDASIMMTNRASPIQHESCF